MKPETNPTAGEQPILSLRIPAETLARIDELAAKTHTSRSVLVRMAIKQGLKKVEQVADLMADQG